MVSQHPYASRSETGPVADHNEDRVLARPEQGLWVVADGMGGHEAGEVASEVVIEAIEEALADGRSLAQAVQHAHQAIKYAAESGRGAPGMGSTVVAMRLDGHDYELAWVGDSRAYLWDPGKDGDCLIQLSHDHSFVQRLVDTGNLTDAEARIHPHRNIITQSLGAVDIDAVDVGAVNGRLYRGQHILLCSDGLTDVLDDAELCDFLRQSRDIQQQVDALVEEVIRREGRDNISVQVISAAPDAPLPGSDAMSAGALRDLTRRMPLLAVLVLILVLILLAAALL